MAAKAGKRCDKDGGFGTCSGKKTCDDDPLYDPSCERMLASVACTSADC